MRDYKKFCWKKSSKNITPPPVDYSKQYMTFKALEDTTFTFTRSALQYSLDNGNTWTTLPADTASPTITEGNKILWKQTGLTPISESGIGAFSATGNFEVSGNIMSLYYGDNFIGQTSLAGKDYAFCSLFNSNTKLVSAENLILPATTLATYCYSNMFRNCTSLTTTPDLPATILAEHCYEGMFGNCTSLTTAPKILPATTLANSCYKMMFGGCTSLITAPALPATTLAEYCYENMFEACTSLTKAPELPATTLVVNCYDGMFRSCTSLTTAPELSATTLALGCYEYMFNGCTALTKAPELPATTLAENCYESMFNGCTSLVTAPELPATTLAENCYNSMFIECSSLSYVDIYANNDEINYFVYDNANGTYGKLVLHGDTPLASQDFFLQQFIGWELWIDDTLIGPIEGSGNELYDNGG